MRRGWAGPRSSRLRRSSGGRSVDFAVAPAAPTPVQYGIERHEGQGWGLDWEMVGPDPSIGAGRRVSRAASWARPEIPSPLIKELRGGSSRPVVDQRRLSTTGQSLGSRASVESARRHHRLDDEATERFREMTGDVTTTLSPAAPSTSDTGDSRARRSGYRRRLERTGRSPSRRRRGSGSSRFGPDPSNERRGTYRTGSVFVPLL